MREGISKYRETGSRMFLPLFSTILAEAVMRKSDWDEARALLELSLDQVDRWGEAFYHAETLRVRGDLELFSTPENLSNPEDWYNQAIAFAQEQEARLWELRAATSLARLWQGQGKTKEAHDLLAPVYDWFTEGFDTADLKDAKALLAELAT